MPHTGCLPPLFSPAAPRTLRCFHRLLLSSRPRRWRLHCGALPPACFLPARSIRAVGLFLSAGLRRAWQIQPAFATPAGALSRGVSVACTLRPLRSDKTGTALRSPAALLRYTLYRRCRRFVAGWLPLILTKLSFWRFPRLRPQRVTGAVPSTLGTFATALLFGTTWILAFTNSTVAGHPFAFRVRPGRRFPILPT